MMYEPSEERKAAWYAAMAKLEEDYGFADETEERLWFCAHGKAYGIRCRRCDEADDD